MFFCEFKNILNKIHSKIGKFFSICIILCFSFKNLFFFDFSNAIFASTFSEAELKHFNTNLELAARNIADEVLKKKEKIVITVLNILNVDTQLPETRGEFLEEQITELLLELTPKKVVPYFEIVSLRLEWRNRYPKIKQEKLTENILKLLGSDWLVTGTYERDSESFNLSLKVIDLNSEDLIWDTVVKSNKVENVITPIKDSLSKTNNDLDRENFFESDSGFSSLVSSHKNKDELLIVPIGMVKIPEGEFIMGSDIGGEDELPDHLVFINSFYLDKFEVTNLEFTRCLSCERGTGGFDTRESEKPVVYVDWSNAYKFCKSKNKRLPTEAEWEYAARAGSRNEYSFGENLKLLENFAWIEANTVDIGKWGAKKVGSKNSNKWGVFDLHGNVMEWVQNYYKPDYFASVRQQNNPKGPLSPSNKKYPLRVVRGGAWGGLYKAGTPIGIRFSKRYSFVEWTRSFQIGFRCAMDIN